VLKLLLMSVILATMALPLFGARIGNPRRALGFVLAGMGLTFLGYGGFLLFIYARLL
jgi:hypothetical protein